MNPVHSMTGFAASDGALPDGTTFSLTLRSVNHRFLDLQIRLAAALAPLEQEVRSTMKQACSRGHVELFVELRQATQTPRLQLNRRLLEDAVACWREAAEILGEAAEPELTMLMRVPGMMSAQLATGVGGELLEAVRASMPALLASFATSREREGRVLAAAIEDGVSQLLECVAALREVRSEVREANLDRLRARLQELLQGAPVSEERLLTEAAILADRSDIEEELVRCDAHLGRVRSLLTAGGPVGKQLDFVIQELHREANTIGSKTGNSAGPKNLLMTDTMLMMKTVIERLREQVQNLE